jgi:hypothetical protein
MGIINYAIKEPDSDEHKPAYKYPFNATEILSGENSYLIDKFFQDSNQVEEEKYEDIEEDIQKKEDEKTYLDVDQDKKEIFEDIDDVTQKIQNLDINHDVETEVENQEDTQKEVTGQSITEVSAKLDDNIEDNNAIEKFEKIDEERDLVKIDSDHEMHEDSKKAFEDAKEKVYLIFILGCSTT